MKTKVYLSVLFGAVSMLSLTACSSDDNESVDNNIIRISTQIANGPDASATRAAANIQSTQFDANETIKIYAVDNQSSTSSVIIDNAIYTQGVGFTTNYYYPATGNPIDIYGMYPSSVGYGTSSFTVSGNQSAPEGYKASDLMSASIIGATRQSTPQALEFHHQLSKIIVNVKRDVSITTEQTATVTLLNVRKTGNIDHGAWTSESSARGDWLSVTVGTTSALTETNQSVAAIIPPQTIAAATQFIQVHLSSGGNYYYSVPSAITFATGMVYTYNIEVGLYGITVTTSIADWDDNNGANTTTPGKLVI